MIRYRYRAMQADGRPVRGELDAEHAADLEARLRALGLVFINGEALPAGRRLRRSVPRRELIHFCFHLEQLVGAGVPVFESLAELRDATRHPRLREIVATVLADIEAGKPLSQAAARHPAVFSRVFVCLLEAGEQSGHLPEAIRDIGAMLAREEELAAHARQVSIYPLVVGSILAVALVMALVHVVPELEKLFRSMGQALPLQTVVLVALSRAVASGWWAMLLVALLLAAALRLALARSSALRIRCHALLLELPLVGEIRRKLALARFAALFATLYAAGITVIEALRATEDVTGNLALREGLRLATARIEQGQRVSSAFESVGVFPPLVARMLRVGEQTGALDRALGNVAELYSRDVRDAIARLQGAIEPTLTVLMGGLLLWIATAVLGPIYDIITRLPA